MTNPYYSKVKFVVESSNGTLENYPATNKHTIEFDATDGTIWMWVEQFRALLRLQGFGERTIKEALGEF